MSEPQCFDMDRWLPRDEQEGPDRWHAIEIRFSRDDINGIEFLGQYIMAFGNGSSGPVEMQVKVDAGPQNDTMHVVAIKYRCSDPTIRREQYEHDRYSAMRA